MTPESSRIVSEPWLSSLTYHGSVSIAAQHSTRVSILRLLAGGRFPAPIGLVLIKDLLNT